MKAEVAITGLGALCAAGRDPESIWDRVRAGEPAVGPIRGWDSSRWPRRWAGEIADLDTRELLRDRKVHKLIRRTDALGLYAATQAVESARFEPQRDALGAEAAAAFNDATGVYVGSSGPAYENEYDFFPLLTRAAGDPVAFGRDLRRTVSPMWLLRNLPNNTLCHAGIQFGFRGPNACITNHSVSGAQAIAEAAQAVACGEAERALAIAHATPVEPQMVRSFDALGLLARRAVRPFDSRREGCLLGEGAAALALESEHSARVRGAAILGRILGSGCASEGEGLLPVRADGDGLARAIQRALEDAGLEPPDVGAIVTHGNGTVRSDPSEAAAIERIFGHRGPPATAFKWSFGHLLAASAALETVLALLALRDRTLPGIPTLRQRAHDCAAVEVSREPQMPTTGVALILSRGFGGMNAALLVGEP